MRACIWVPRTHEQSWLQVGHNSSIEGNIVGLLAARLTEACKTVSGIRCTVIDQDTQHPTHTHTMVFFVSNLVCFPLGFLCFVCLFIFSWCLVDFLKVITALALCLWACLASWRFRAASS